MNILVGAGIQKEAALALFHFLFIFLLSSWMINKD